LLVFLGIPVLLPATILRFAVLAALFACIIEFGPL
jgi:hypothetical protein